MLSSLCFKSENEFPIKIILERNGIRIERERKRERERGSIRIEREKEKEREKERERERAKPRKSIWVLKSPSPLGTLMMAWGIPAGIRS